MIEHNNGYFFLHTKNTSYGFCIMETGQLEHLYYGQRISAPHPASMREKHQYAPGCTVIYTPEHFEFTLEEMCLEASGRGKGDTREPFVEVIAPDGSFTTDFVYESHEILEKKQALKTLPSAYDEIDQASQLIITMRDKNNGYALRLNYSVFYDTDVIVRSAIFVNDSDEPMTLTKLASAQVDFNERDLVVTSFHGHWAKEMSRFDTKVNVGKFVNESTTGNSSNQANPFIMVHPEQTSEDAGDCYAFNLIYSGNHAEIIEVNAHGKTRVVTGINNANFAFKLGPGEEFETPEAVLSYSKKGYNGISQNMHAFVREHIVRGQWKRRPRPILLNSWEAFYFDFTENKLLKLAKKGKEAGIELFVLDDGWFGVRNDDHRSLGDWQVNIKKLPSGIAGLAKKVNDLGLDFGLWIEPEMVNIDSDLYRAHPDWVLEIPGKDHSEGRTQRVLDFTNPAVVENITAQISALLESANISYIKWDMNRNISDCFSQHLPAERQGEVYHRYIMGVYEMAKALTEKFPHVLFEGCASGGNRFDLGMLCYFPQIWASDNTDAVSRLAIQNGYSFGYPMSTVSAHVSSCPNHQTQRVTPIESRFGVAAFGLLGYECNLLDASAEDLKEIKAQIALYKQWRELFFNGNFYRIKEGDQYQWIVVSPDKKKAVGFMMQQLATSNVKFEKFRAKGLDPELNYHFSSLPRQFNIKEFGDLVNTVSPIHIKQGSLLHNLLAKFVKMDAEVEDMILSGAALMGDGAKLAQAFVATGYSEGVRHFPDYASRMYFIEAVSTQLLPESVKKTYLRDL